MSNLKASIMSRISEIGNAEKVTKVQLAVLSRELLLYVPDSQDIQVVNKLIEVLTPMNKRVAFLFFANFLPWEVERDNDKKPIRFGKKSKGPKTIASKAESVKTFLSEESNSIWTWSSDNVEVKQKDLRTAVGRAVKQALNGHEKSGTAPIAPMDIVMAVLENGISIDDMIDAVSFKESQINIESAENKPTVEAEV